MPTNANALVLALKNAKERLSITVSDAAGAPATPSSIELIIQDLGETILHKDAFPALVLTGTLATTVGSAIVTGTGTAFNTELTAGDTFTLSGNTFTVDTILGSTQLRISAAATVAVSGTASRPTRIVNPAVGTYYIDWGDPTAPANTPNQTETSKRGTQLALWQVEDSAGDQTSVVQTIRVVTPKTLSLLPGFEKLIDKSRKLVNTDDDCFLGYTSADLVQYLEEGLSLINAYEPYPVWGCLDDFPLQFIHVLYQSALVSGVMSQQLFAIDTDIPNFSDQGNSFVIQHAPQLAAALNQITQQLDKIIPLMKYKFVATGSVHIQAGNNFRLAQLLQAAPNGALFRNVYFRGS